MAKKRKSTKKRNSLTAVTATILLPFVLLPLILGWGIYYALSNDTEVDTFPSHTLPYVDGDEAAEQVENFYRQYIQNAKKPAIQKKLIGLYGNKNLVFYNQYYQHGFDPIICSTVTPLKVTASVDSTGPVAIVKAVAELPDHSKLPIVARVVLTDEMKVDSITCPGKKGNLSPEAMP